MVPQPRDIPLPQPTSWQPISKDTPTDPNHPLWQFFRPDRKTLTPPKEDAKHGRAWTAEELRGKSFEDLHSLWHVCLRERNILSTQRHERRRQRIKESGDKEAGERDRTVRKTMQGIKFVLSERMLAWQEARELAERDGTLGTEQPALDSEASPTIASGTQSRLTAAEESRETTSMPAPA